MREYCIGIDFGTCFSFSAFVPSIKKEPISLLERKDDDYAGLPSVFYHDKLNPYLCGTDAVDFAESEIYDKLKTVEFIKQNLLTTPLMLDGGQVSPREIVARLLAEIINNANEQLNIHFPGSFVSKIAMAVPVSFREHERSILIEAAQSLKTTHGIEINVIGLIEEPFAAALDYFGYTGVTDPVLVYDLGGGTVDVAYIKTDGNGLYTTVAHDGDRIGGRDWDNALFDELRLRFQKIGITVNKNSWVEQELRKEAIKLKHKLSEFTSATSFFHEKYLLRYVDEGERVKITRDEFEKLTYKSCLSKTLDVVRNVLNRTSLGNKREMHVILVGGGSYMPQVEKGIIHVLHNEFKVNILNKGNMLYRPSQAIAYGTARYASGVKIQSISSFSYGIALKGNKSDYYIKNIIRRNTNLPYYFSIKEPLTRSKVLPYHSSEINWAFIPLYEHDEDAPTSDPKSLKQEFRDYRMHIDFKFKKPLPEGTQIEVMVELQDSGVLKLLAKNPETGEYESRYITINRYINPEQALDD